MITPDTGDDENGSDAGIQTGENGGAEGTDLLQDEKAATLLIVTKGTLTELTEAEPYQNRYGKEVKEIIPKTRNGRMASDTGYYAISYGIGNQKIGEASRNLTPTISWRAHA